MALTDIMMYQNQFAYSITSNIINKSYPFKQKPDLYPSTLKKLHTNQKVLLSFHKSHVVYFTTVSYRTIHALIFSDFLSFSNIYCE